MKAIGFIAVCIVLSLVACKTTTIAERGMQGGASFGSSSSDFSYPSRSKTVSSPDEGIQSPEEKNSIVVYIPSGKIEKFESHGIKQQKSNGRLNQKNIASVAANALHRNSTINKNRSNQTSLNPNDNPSEGSIRWFVYFLLCFLIPPLAYFLIKRSSDTMFWVCLICYLLTLSLFGGFRYGILGLLSIVIALLALFQIDI